LSEQSNNARRLRQRAAFLAGALAIATSWQDAFAFFRQADQNAIQAANNASAAQTAEGNA
jgi:hypothetical protein